jgi:hypothetical protein
LNTADQIKFDEWLAQTDSTEGQKLIAEASQDTPTKKSSASADAISVFWLQCTYVLGIAITAALILGIFGVAMLAANGYFN